MPIIIRNEIMGIMEIGFWNRGHLAMAWVVEAAGRAIGHGLQAHVYRLKGHRTIFSHIAGNAQIAHTLGLVEGRIALAQSDELLEISHVLTYINHLKTVVAHHLLLHIFAMGASFHDIHLNHNLIFPFLIKN